MKVCCIGLGYVGLPLALELSKHYEVTGFDIDEQKISQCLNGTLNLSIKFTSNPKQISNHDIYIVCVPTPVDSNKKRIYGRYLRQLKLLESLV